MFFFIKTTKICISTAVGISQSRYNNKTPCYIHVRSQRQVTLLELPLSFSCIHADCCGTLLIHGWSSTFGLQLQVILLVQVIGQVPAVHRRRRTEQAFNKHVPWQWGRRFGDPAMATWEGGDPAMPVQLLEDTAGVSNNISWLQLALTNEVEIWNRFKQQFDEFSAALGPCQHIRPASRTSFGDLETAASWKEPSASTSWGAGGPYQTTRIQIFAVRGLQLRTLSMLECCFS